MGSKYEIRWAEVEKFLKLTGVKRARISGVPKETWSRWKRGDLPPNTKRIREMAPKFGLTYIEMVVALEEMTNESADTPNAA